jgi:elongation factor Ts
MANLEEIKKLRAETQSGIADAKEALDASNGDYAKALEYLKKKGIEKQGKKADREINQGWIGSYVHNNGKVAVLVEINCETDFVSNTDEFKNFTKDIALQIAGMNPKYIDRTDIPEEELAALEQKAMEGVSVEGKPEEVVKAIKEGKLKKVFEETVLLDQQFLKDENQTIRELVSDAVLKFGENVKIKRFVRYQMGE